MSLQRKLKPRRCRQCPEEFIPTNSRQVVCSMPCAIAYGATRTEKNAKAQERREAKMVREHRRKLKERLKTRAQWIKEAERAFNAYIRERDHGKPCISCGDAWEAVIEAQGWKPGGAWDCGHFRTRGAAGQLRFNLQNAHAQCKSCNGGAGKFGHFNNREATISQRYEINLVERIGMFHVERLKNDNSKRRFTIAYCRRVKSIFTRRARLYQKRRALVTINPANPRVYAGSETRLQICDQ